YWEHAAYVALVRGAYELWDERERFAGEVLLATTGSIDAGPHGSRHVRGVLEACNRFGLRHQTFDGPALHQEFPGYRLPPDLVAIVQPDGGFLLPERCVAAHVDAAVRAGATVHTNEIVIDWSAGGAGVVVRTDRSRYSARHLVVTAGPWAGKVVGALRPLVAVERQV